NRWRGLIAKSTAPNSSLRNCAMSDLLVCQQLRNKNNSLVGLKLVLPDICGTCCAHELAVISPNSELHCTKCAASRGHLGPKTRKFLTEIVNRFGCPTEIVMRWSIVCREAAITSDKPAAASHKTIMAVVNLAGTDRRLAAVSDQWDADPWVLNTPDGV